MAGRRRDDQHDEGYHTNYDARRRHRSQPPKSNRASSPVRDDHPQRPKLVTRDDSYYDPRDVYYLSDTDGPEDHPWFASRREDSSARQRGHSSPRRRDQSSPRRREESRDRGHRHRATSRSHRPHSKERRRPHSGERHRSRSEDRHQRQHDEDERQSRHSRHNDGQETFRPPRRSMTAAPPSRNHHGEHSHPPSASRSNRVRSSTVGSKDRKRSRSSSSSPIDQIMGRKDIIMEAAKVALEAGAMAALKMHDEPGPWIGIKGTKVLSTALGAAAVDTFVSHRKPNMKGGMRHSAVKQAAQVALVNLVAKPAVKHTRFGKT